MASPKPKAKPKSLKPSEASPKPIANASETRHVAFKEFIEEFKNESDRAAVILGTAKLDLLLYQLLQSTLRPCTSRSDELLDGDSPLGNFSARIALSHRLGLIDDEFCRALHIIRRIRNSFAHELSGTKLDSGAHRDRIHELTAPFKRSESFGYFLDRYFGEKAGPAAEFRTAVAVAALRLQGAIKFSTPLNTVPFELVLTDFKREKFERLKVVDSE